MTNTTQARRYFGKCDTKGCKHRAVFEGAYYGPNGQCLSRQCPNHPGMLTWRELKAKVTEEKECNGVCMGAVGPSCDCSCGGENHGTAKL